MHGVLEALQHVEFPDGDGLLQQSQSTGITHHDGVAPDVVPTIVRGVGEEPLEAHCVEIEPHVFLVGVYGWF
jgi:hypothetical protein